MSGRPSLPEILRQPELFHIIDEFAKWHRPPVFLDTAAVGVLAGLGQTSVAIREGAATGARGYPNARASLQLSNALLYHGTWTEAWHNLLAQQIAATQEPGYVSNTP